jgi:hypothetical protein
MYSIVCCLVVGCFCPLQKELERQDKYPNLVEPHRLKGLTVRCITAFPWVGGRVCGGGPSGATQAQGAHGELQDNMPLGWGAGVWGGRGLGGATQVQGRQG